MSKKIITKQLRHIFNTRELADVATKVSELVKEVEDREARKKAVSAQLKAEVEQVVNDLRVVSGKHRDGYEWRGIECEKDMDFRKGLVSITRLDTGEVIEERAMTTEERQQELQLERQEGQESGPEQKDDADDPDDPDDGTAGDDNGPVEIEA